MAMAMATIKDTTGTLGYGTGFVNGIARYMTWLADRDYHRRGSADSTGCFMMSDMRSSTSMVDRLHRIHRL